MFGKRKSITERFVDAAVDTTRSFGPRATKTASLLAAGAAVACVAASAGIGAVRKSVE